MSEGPRAHAQLFLPGLEPQTTGSATPGRPRRRGSARPPKAPSIDSLLAGAAPRVRKTFGPLRTALLAEPGVGEHVRYDDLAHTFSPSYSFRDREVLRLHLDPILAATVTLDAGERQLAELLRSPELPEPLKTQALKCARRSGRRVFLAFPVRNSAETANLLSLLRGRIALDVN